MGDTEGGERRGVGEGGGLLPYSHYTVLAPAIRPPFLGTKMQVGATVGCQLFRRS